MKRNQRSTTMTDQNGFSQYTPVQFWSPRNKMQIEWKVSCVCNVCVCKYIDLEFNNILQKNSSECVLVALCYSFVESCISQLGKRGTNNRSVFSWWNLKRIEFADNLWPISKYKWYDEHDRRVNFGHALTLKSEISVRVLDIKYHQNKRIQLIYLLFDCFVAA